MAAPRSAVLALSVLALTVTACQSERPENNQQTDNTAALDPAPAGPGKRADDTKTLPPGSRIVRGENESAAPPSGAIGGIIGTPKMRDRSFGASPSASAGGYSLESAPPSPPRMAQPAPVDRDKFEDVDPNSVVSVEDQPVSTFSVDVDTASYSIVRRYLNNGVLPPRDAVRVEEMVNYFDYDYPLPTSAGEPFQAAIEVMPSPWNPDTQLMRIGVQGYDLASEETKPLNLVLLLDVSGSMNAPDKLPLLKKALGLLIDTLGDEDRVSIVVYAGAAGVILEPTPGADRGTILAALDGLSAGGSTAGGEGIEMAYTLAERNMDKERLNRVILATDGDFNVGITDPQKLEDFVARKRDTGIFLTILGFGQGNLNDAMMQRLVQAGNGQAAYIDTLQEARKVLVDDVRATLFPIAKDVKIQVEFNPARVAEYRLIGYETRLLDRSDFNNDKVDAGEVGSGHSVTALYEIAAPGSDGQLIDPLRYGKDEAEPADEGTAQASDEIAFFRLRYKQPDEDESRLIETPVTDGMVAASLEDASQEARFAAAVAGVAQILRGDPAIKSGDLGTMLDLALAARGEDTYGYRAEFTQLVRLAQSAKALDTR